MAKMKVDKFVSMAKKIATEYKTLYVMGGFGAPLTKANKTRYINNYAYNKQTSRQKMINSASSDTFAFDCVCLIKGILWGFNADKKNANGGAKYGSNGVPDFGTENMLSYCNDVSSNFKKIEVGEVLYMKNHAGIYIGNGLAIECTPAWKNKVQITAVGNIGTKKGYNSRKWTKHGKLKFIDYNKKEEAKKEDTTKHSQNSSSNGSNLNETTKYYKIYAGKSKSIVEALNSLKIDSSFKNRTKIAKANGIKLYLGTASQNIKLLELLKKGKLKRA